MARGRRVPRKRRGNILKEAALGARAASLRQRRQSGLPCSCGPAGPVLRAGPGGEQLPPSEGAGRSTGEQAGCGGTRQVWGGWLWSSKGPGGCSLYFPANSQAPARAGDSLEPVPEARGRKDEACAPQAASPSPPTLISAGLPAHGRRERASQPSSLTCGFPDPWRASNYPVIALFIASLQVTTFWQAFP